MAAEGVAASSPVLRNIIEWPLFQKLNADPNVFPTYRPTTLQKGQFALDRCQIATAMADRAVRLHLDEFVTAADMRDTAKAIRKVAKWYAANPGA